MSFSSDNSVTACRIFIFKANFMYTRKIKIFILLTQLKLPFKELVVVESTFLYLELLN